MNIFENVCRTCNNVCAKLLNIFDDKLLKNTINIQEMLIACCQIPLHVNDGFPQSICYLCAKQLEIAFNFQKQCRKVFEEFQTIGKYVGNRSTDSQIKSESDVNDTNDITPPQKVTDTLAKNSSNEIESNAGSNSSTLLPDNELDYANMSNETLDAETNPNEGFHLLPDTNDTEVQSGGSNYLRVDLVDDEPKASCVYCDMVFFTTKALSLHEKITHKKPTSNQFKSAIAKFGQIERKD